MKILLVGPDLADPGGVANYYNAVLPHLTDDSTEVEYLQIGSTHAGGSRLYLLTDQVAFWRRIGAFDPDIVHINPSLDLKSYLRDGMFIFQAALRRRKVLVFFRGWQVGFQQRVRGWLRWFFDRTYAKAARFIVLASGFADALRGWGISVPVDTGTTTVSDELLEGFDIERKRSDLADAPVLSVLYMARLERGKGVLVLLQALSSLLREGLSLKLTIAGDGEAMQDIRDYVAGMGEHADRIEIAGYVRGEQKASMLTSHHIFCFPTMYGEGMPNAVLEAMAFGMPVITTPVGGLGDFFVHGDMGHLLQQVDESSVAKAISVLSADRDALMRIAEFNHRYAQEHFLASECAAFLKQVYRNMQVAGP